MGFHLAEREPVARSIAAASAARTFEELQEAIRNYEGHDLAQNQPYTAPQTSPHANPIMIVSEKPEDEDRQEGRPFCGEYGRIMRNALSLIGVNLEAMHVAYAIHWTPPEDKSPNKTIIAASRPFLYREIELVQPRILLAQGRAVIEALNGYRGPALEVYGHTMGFKHGDMAVQMYCTAHPAYSIYSSSYFSTFLENLKEFFSLHGRLEEQTAPGSFKTPVRGAFEGPIFPRLKAA